MSSCGNPETETAALMPRRLKFDRSKACVKCKFNIGNLVIRHAVYCKECFYPLMTTKFKRILEPTVNPTGTRARKKALKAEGNLFLAYSGGVGSTVLLDLVSRCYFTSADEEDENPRGGKNHPRNGNVWNNVYVCYVEVCNAFPEARDKTEEICAAVERYDGFEMVPLRIENAFDKSWWDAVGERPSNLKLSVDIADEDLLVSISRTSNDANPVESLRSYISRLPTQTAVASTIRTLVRILLLYTAAAARCSHLLLGTSLTSLSVSLISSISQGAGFSVREEIEEQWMPISSTNVSIDGASGQQGNNSSGQVCIRIIRPLREIGMKECAIWAWWNGLKVVGRETIPGLNQSIGVLTKNFIIRLEQDYPSTVSAIARTCGKLAPKEVSSGSCALCQRPVPPDVEQWKARISIKSMSLTIDQSATQDIITRSTEPKPLAPYLCYACHTTLTSRSSRGMSKASAVGMATLPVWVQNGLPGTLLDFGRGDGPTQTSGDREESGDGNSRRMDRAEMRDTVSEFLLD